MQDLKKGGLTPTQVRTQLHAALEDDRLERWGVPEEVSEKQKYLMEKHHTGGVPEVLLLKNLKWAKGLPVGLTEVEAIEKLLAVIPEGDSLKEYREAFEKGPGQRAQDQLAEELEEHGCPHRGYATMRPGDPSRN